MTERLNRSRQERENNHESDKQPNRAEVAVDAALTGYAVDGGNWLSGRDAFMRAASEGRSINAALTAALDHATKADIEPGEQHSESTQVEAMMRFWDNMDPDRKEGEEPTPAIERALTGFAPDVGSWLQARGTFEERIKAGDSIEEALKVALNQITATRRSETDPRVAMDRFYGGVDPDYAEADHVNGRRYGLRLRTERGTTVQVGLGPDEEKARQRRLRKLNAKHRP